MKEERKKTIILIILLSLVGGIGYALFFKFTNIGLPCPIHELFHVNCPGCGISRMFMSILELNFYQAFRYNPLLFILFPFAIVLMIDASIAYINERNTKIYSKVPIWGWIILLVIIIGFGIIRNIEPFTFLSPTEIVDKK